MSQGKLLALDTAQNIKRRFGVGYNLLLEPKAQGIEGLSQFQKAKSQIDDIILRQSGITSVEESNDSTPKKLIYLIPFDQ